MFKKQINKKFNTKKIQTNTHIEQFENVKMLAKLLAGTTALVVSFYYYFCEYNFF